jgi:co-chaperonin GroES (HSP10)
MKRLVPIGTQVLIIPIDEGERKTAGGIIIPNMNKNGYVKGVVKEKGNGNKWNDMNEIKKGDIVSYSRGAGITYRLPNEDGVLTNYILLDYKQLVWVE